MAMRRFVAVLALALIAAALPSASPAETTVRWVTTTPPTSLDPHASNNLSNRAIINQIFDTLLKEDSRQNFQPTLALRWSLETRTSWRFALRPGVSFHNGGPLTAEDVVFSLKRAAGERSAMRREVANVADIRVIDPLTVLVITKAPDLFLPYHLSDVSIISRRWAEQHDLTSPATAAPIASMNAAWGEAGTGPYRVESFKPGDRLVLTKVPTWWGAELYPAAVDRLEQRVVSSQADAAALITAGDVDYAGFSALPPDALTKLEATPGLQLERTELALTRYLGFDLATPELRTSRVTGRNPFKDHRVREAIYRAIDFNVLSAAVAGLAAPAGMIVGRTASGWSEALDRRLPYDPGRARQLMAEAGYADGFGVALDAPDLGREILPPIQTMLARIGIVIEIHIHPVGEVERLIAERRTDFFLWGFTEEHDSSWTFRGIYRSSAPAAAPGVASVELDALIDTVDAETVNYVRDARIEQVWRRVIDDILYVPLCRPIYLWAMRAPFDLPVGSSLSPWFGEAWIRK
jgi:peptide/nickel transport system substrate-binding protein